MIITNARLWSMRLDFFPGPPSLGRAVPFTDSTPLRIVGTPLVTTSSYRRAVSDANSILNSAVGATLLTAAFLHRAVPNANATLNSAPVGATLLTSAFLHRAVPNANSQPLRVVRTSLVYANILLCHRAMPDTHSTPLRIVGTSLVTATFFLFINAVPDYAKLIPLLRAFVGHPSRRGRVGVAVFIASVAAWGDDAVGGEMMVTGHD